MFSRLLSAGLLLALAALALRRARRTPDTDMRTALKRQSRRNRAYWFSLPPIERPK